MTQSDPKPRSYLRTKFATNSIPSEQDFGDLIDASLNQHDDNLWKRASEPLSLRAETSGAALQFYDLSSQQPDWQLSLRDGLCVVDRQDVPRLQIKPDGSLSVGELVATKLDVSDTLTTQTLDASVIYSTILMCQPRSDAMPAQLHVDLNRKGTNLVGARLTVAVRETVPSGQLGLPNAAVMFSSEECVGLVVENPYVPWIREDRASLRFQSSPAQNPSNWDVGVRSDGAFTFRTDAEGGITSVVDRFAVRSDAVHVHDKLKFEDGTNTNPVPGRPNNAAATIEVGLGDLVIRLSKGYWVFLDDGDLVRYDDNNVELWRSGKS